MGKRSEFERTPRDFYPTPYEAVVPLLAHLYPRTKYVEPCCGDGALVEHLSQHGHICLSASDIEPKMPGADVTSAMEIRDRHPMFITNPPWDRKILHPMIEHLCDLAPTWLLIDADWMHTKQSHKLMTFCRKIVSVGRVKWIPGSTMTGKDNCAWYLFDRHSWGHPTFHRRIAA